MRRALKTYRVSTTERADALATELKNNNTEYDYDRSWKFWESYLRKSITTWAFGTQNVSSFLCHKADNGVSRIRWGRFAGWKKWLDNSSIKSLWVYLWNLLLFNLQVSRDKLVGTGEEEFSYVVLFLGLHNNINWLFQSFRPTNDRLLQRQRRHRTFGRRNRYHTMALFPIQD